MVAGQLLLLVALAFAGPLGRRSADVFLGRFAAGICLLYAAWTGLAGVRQLGRHLTPMPTPTPGSQLLTSGIFGHVRHPLYASTLALALGWTLWWNSPLALLLSLVLGAWLHGKARLEEVWLRQRFPGYAAYAQQVPRYFPRLRRRPTPPSAP